MDLKTAVGILLTKVLNQLRYHPLFSPYLRTSAEDPPTHYLHQCEVIVRLALRKPIRVLIGDEIGLGKTVTALAVAKYLEAMGRAKRILVIVPRVLVLQWRKELTRMGIPTSRIRHLEREYISYYEKQDFPEGYYIASMDLLKREERISQIVDVEWDLIIVDEVHKFGFRTKRFHKIGKMLIEEKPSRNVIFLSATPHRGDPKDYIQRLRLLDPYISGKWKTLDDEFFYKLTHGSLLFRRTKEDVNTIYEGRDVFTDARFYAYLIAGSEDEKKFIDALVSFLRTKLRELAYQKNLVAQKVIPLLVTLVFKRATSCPYSAMTTLQRLLTRRVMEEIPKDLIVRVESFLRVGYEDLEYERDPDEIFNDFLDVASSLLHDTDRRKIEELYGMARSIIERGDTKLNATLSLIEDILSKSDSKVIVFTEYKDTLEYIYGHLLKRHPEWGGSILRLSSEEARDEKLFNEVRRAFENDPKARILIATDVIAEGVNLQVANIVINYEIPWSLIKLEQRIGRVWRLGQKRDVEAYTLFMDNIVDKAALNSMYQKLFNLRQANLQPRPVTGQKVLYYAETKDIKELPMSVALTKERKRKFFRVTEANSIKTYLEKDEVGLQELVESILAAKQEIEKEISSKQILYKPRSRNEVENVIKTVGFKDHKEVFDALKNLLKASAPIVGIEVLDEGGSIKIRRGSEMPTYVNTLDDIFTLLDGRSTANESVCIVSQSDGTALISLVPVSIRDRRDGALLYTELVGVDLVSGEILRGTQLIATISQAIRNLVGVTKLDNKDIPIHIIANIIDYEKRGLSEFLHPMEIYRSRLEGRRLRSNEGVWIRRSDIDVSVSDPVGYLQFVKMSTTSPESVSEEVKREIEKRAIEEVLAYERAKGREPIDVSATEHYDIRSVDPSTGEVRYIEVKGHKGLEISAEITESEAEVAQREKERYWLYIVYDIGSGHPKILEFQNPLETMDMQVFERREKRYFLRPKTGGARD